MKTVGEESWNRLKTRHTARKGYGIRPGGHSAMLKFCKVCFSIPKVGFSVVWKASLKASSVILFYFFHVCSQNQYPSALVSLLGFLSYLLHNQSQPGNQTVNMSLQGHLTQRYGMVTSPLVTSLGKKSSPHIPLFLFLWVRGKECAPTAQELGCFICQAVSTRKTQQDFTPDPALCIELHMISWE